MRKLVGTLAVVTLVAHLLALPATLEDLDSVNFALGVRHFDVAEHQPHPPGYPVFIALGKLGTSLAARLGIPSPDVRGLAVWSALGAGMLPLCFFAFFRRIAGEDGDVRAAIASLLVVASPLFWFTASRPLSDVAGLAAAWGALAALASGLSATRAPGDRPLTPVFAGACLAGLSIGFRSQMAILTMPMVLWSFFAVARARIGIVGATAAGVLAWAVPLVLFSGGPRRYLSALGSQAGEDFSGVVMLWTHPTPRAAFAAVIQTFVRPWDSPVLAGVMLALAAAGAVVLLLRAPRALGLLAIAFGPYAMFHLLFQETVTIRYALPLVPLVAFLAAATLTEADARLAGAGAIAIAAAGLALAMPATAAYARTPSPYFGMLAEMRLLEERGAKPIVSMHRRVLTESRRARVYAGNLPGTLLAAPRDYEWLELTRAWREGHDGETWFVADPRRTDLALVDQAHARTRAYRWPFDGKVYVGGARPDELDWHVVDSPGWFLEQGWALTPETAGIAERDGWGPHRKPSIGWIRRRGEEAMMVIGGRNLGSDAPVGIGITIDERPFTHFLVQPGFFLQFVPVPAGLLAGEGRFARLAVSALKPAGVAGRAFPDRPAVAAIEQFNVQSADRVQYGFDEGWFEAEYNPTTARSWRWMGERAVVRVHHAGRNVTLTISGESPLRYFDAAPRIRVLAGDRVLAELTPSADFSSDISIPADALAAASGRIVLTSDRVFVAGEKEGTADRRRLAIKVYELRVQPTS